MIQQTAIDECNMMKVYHTRSQHYTSESDMKGIIQQVEQMNTFEMDHDYIPPPPQTMTANINP